MGIEIKNPFGGEIDTFNELLAAVLRFLYYLAIPAVVVMIVASGVLFLLSRGDPGKIKQAKDILLYAVIGLVIILIGGGFVDFLESIFSASTIE